MSDRNKGFTLIELILVLSIITMLSVSVIPVFRGTFHSVQDDHAVRDLMATIRYAQERAITDTTEMRLYLQPDLNQYYLARLIKIEQSGKMFESLAERHGEPVRLSERQTLQKPEAKFDPERNAYYITFRPSGACDPATIAITKSDGTVARILTSGSLARLKVTQ